MSSTLDMYPNNRLSILFKAVVQSTEESIVNALIAAETMVGADDATVFELPEGYLRDKFR